MKKAVKTVACNKCGSSKDIVSGKNVCRICRNSYMREWNSRHRESVRNRDREYKKKFPDKFRDSRLRSTFGISLDDYNAIFIKQNGVCAICERFDISYNMHGVIKNLCVDHDHKTGSVRGLLCMRCNKALGSFYDDISLLKNAIKYLSSQER